ncbi:MAG TPA: NAD(P)H-quinone oxidoreductase [Sandaracinaceae bacterium LLY-WYZ-13_1]|nr:NAD(P)H-quinone oxidoreductase [Sandaracinaceae bacterium LLY-WYZ-13_1]
MPIARAVRIKEAGGPEVLHVDRVSVDDPGPGQILVEVAGAGLNRADLLQRRGLYPAPPGAPSDVPGLEYAGRVAAVGDGVSLFSTGDDVMGIVPGGAMATHLVVHEREAIGVPDGLAISHAAAIPEAFLTAYDALFAQAELAAGEQVLIHAVASGVGTAALQLARLAGARPLGTSRSAWKLERCAPLGLMDGLCVTEKAFADEVLERTGGRGVDVVLDLVGAGYLRENLSALAPRGRMVVIGLLGGIHGELPLGVLMKKRLRLMGSTLRARPIEEKAALARRFADRVAPLFDADGPLTPVVDRVMPMSEIQDAHALMERNETVGKVVMTWS